MKNSNAILLIVCPDQPGLVAEVSNFVHGNDGNIIFLDQHTDPETKTFLMRLEWELNQFKIPQEDIEEHWNKIATKYRMKYQLHFSSHRPKIALMVSKYQHCLYDLLVRCALDEINAEIPLIISNHEDLKKVAEHFSIPYYFIPVNQENKSKAESEQISLLKDQKVDLVVLARYMQILSPKFIDNFPNQIINIHHSFLPAFKGGKPYHQAYQKGVKIIGATSHYVTEDLDMGPIIQQSVTRVSHTDTVDDMIRKGRDQEKVALAYAVRMHTQHRILTYNNKTVVFE